MEFFCLPALIFFLLSVLSLLLFLHTKNQSNNCISTGLKSYPLVGTLPGFLKNRHRFLEWVTEILINHPANTFAVRVPGDVGGIVTANPMNVEHILKTNFENYPKGDWITDVLHDFLGVGIFSADGEMWKPYIEVRYFCLLYTSSARFGPEIYANDTQEIISLSEEDSAAKANVSALTNM